MVRLTVRLFAGLADAFESDEVEFEFEECPTASALLARMIAARPAHEGLIQASRVAADAEFVASGATVPDNVEVAIIPPVSGG